MSSSRTSFLIASLLALGLAAVLMWPRFGKSPAQRGQQAEADGELSTSWPAADAGLVDASDSAVAAVSRAGSQADAEASGPCPDGMVYVEGIHCPFVAHRCASFLGLSPEPSPRLRRRDAQRRCGRYHDDLICEGRPSELKFCIDRLEYPNLAGVEPVVMVDYRQAKRACAVEAKRLCEAEEWTFACEGARTWPYPTGLEREPGMCNIDRRPRAPNLEALAVPFDVSTEVARLDQRVPSGSSSRCVSPFGVMDMSGNVAEWVHNREGKNDRSSRVTAIAGGHWERVPATCRLLDASHGARHRAHQLGFRCCADASDGRPARRLMPREFRLPRRRKLLK